VLKEQVDLFPRSPGVYESLAWAYYEQGEKDLAKHFFTKVLELDKKNSLAKGMLKKLK
jgi:Tfp pilus assembly protein PilF